MNPHVDTVTTAAEVHPAMMEAMAGSGYVIRVGVPRLCLTCGEVVECRFGHCFPCVSATTTFVDLRPGDPYD